MLSKLKLKYIQSLGQKKLRDAENVFVAEGPKLLAELLAATPSSVREIYALESWTSSQDKSVREKTTVIDEIELSRISQLSTPNQVLAVVERFEEWLPDLSSKGIILALDSIQDPGNLGTIIRIADWFGIDHIVCSHQCADVYNSKVVQSSMGSIARVHMSYTDLAAWLLASKQKKIYAMVLEGNDITSMQKLEDGIILVGSEGKGINPALLDLVTMKITIPKKGKAESLNAAIATGIALAYLV